MFLLTEWKNIWHKVIAGQLHREPNIFPVRPELIHIQSKYFILW